MNLIQIQNRLKEMPTQVVMQYANGRNPMVPPYLALGELNRRKQVEQEARPTEAPQQSVKEKIENDVRTMQTMAGRQQEAMQRQGQAMAQQNMVAPQSTPATDAEGMASGGIARLNSNFNFGGGGIVAFAAGDKVTEDADTYRKKYLEEMTTPVLNLPKSQAELLEEAKQKNPELAEKAGTRYERLLEQIAERDQADRDRFKQQEKERQDRRLVDIVSGAGSGMSKFAPKEQKGVSGILNLLGGIGRESATMREADIDRMNKQRGMEREQDILQAKMFNEIDAARRAEARGDVKAQAEHEQKVADLKNQFQTNRLTAFGKAADITETLRHNLTEEQLKSRQLQQQAAQNNRDLIRERAIYLASLPENKGKPMTELLQMAATLAMGAQFDSAEVRRLKEAEAAWEKGKFDRLQQKIKPGSPEEQTLRKEHYRRWGLDPDAKGGSSSGGKWSKAEVEKP